MCSGICIKRRYSIKKSKTSRFGNTVGYENTATGKSVIWEKWASDYLGAQWVNEEIMGKPYDLLLGKLKIDVKAANYYVRKMKRGKLISGGGGWWSFKSNQYLKPELDYYLCICLYEKKPYKVLLVPASEYHKQAGLCVGWASKYDIYNIYNAKYETSIGSGSME